MEIRLLLCLCVCCSLPLRAAERIEPTAVNGLRAWFDAQQLKGGEGSEVTKWSSRAGAKDVSLVQVKTLQNDSKSAAPQLATAKVNAFDYQCVRFNKGKKDEADLLKAAQVVPDGHPARTVVMVYRLTGSTDTGGSRVAGFGSSVAEDDMDLRLWNFGVDSTRSAYGSSRFNGTYIGPYQGKTYAEGQLLIRTAVMHQEGTFSDYIQPVHDFFSENQRLHRKRPPEKLKTVVGDFFVGDMHIASTGGNEKAVDMDIFEILVYDRELKDNERQGLQRFLNWKYTNPISQASSSGGGLP